METAETVRKAIEAAKAEVIGLQHNGILGRQSVDLSVKLFALLDEAWLQAYKLQQAREIGL